MLGAGDDQVSTLKGKAYSGCHHRYVVTGQSFPRRVLVDPDITNELDPGWLAQFSGRSAEGLTWAVAELLM